MKPTPINTDTQMFTQTNAYTHKLIHSGTNAYKCNENKQRHTHVETDVHTQTDTNKSTRNNRQTIALTAAPETCSAAAGLRSSSNGSLLIYAIVRIRYLVQFHVIIEVGLFVLR